MFSKGGFIKKLLFVLIVLGAGVGFWYSRLDDNHQRYVKNLLKQIPELPGRYTL